MNREMTGDEFYEILKGIVEKKISVSELLAIPDVYEALSERYNNEALEIWEQRKDGDADDEEENRELFSFVLHERCGERESTFERLVISRSMKEAEKKAEMYCSKWYPFDSTYQFIKHKNVHIFDAGTRYVTAVNFKKVDKDYWMKKAYREALIL